MFAINKYNDTYNNTSDFYFTLLLKSKDGAAN